MTFVKIDHNRYYNEFIIMIRIQQSKKYTCIVKNRQS